MEIKKEIINGDGFKVPCVTLKPSNSKGAAVVAPSYGGSKEEVLGLAWRIAQEGFTTGALDLRGHGKHPLDLDEDILQDLETALSHFRNFGKVTAVGHSLGGRLSLISSADYAVGISPAISKTFGPETQGIIEQLRDYRVRKADSNVFRILNDAPLSQFDENKALIIYGSRDVPEIMAECEKLKSSDLQIVQIENALHADIITSEKTFETVAGRLQDWYV